MKPSTSLLISLRDKSKLVDVKKKKWRRGKANRCFQNAAFFSADRKGFEIVSGWLVGDNFEGLGTVFLPHYWVLHTPSGEYFDTTPTAEEDIQLYEYVLDMDIYLNLTRTSYVPPPVRLRESGILQVRLSETQFVDIETIDIKHLYSLIRSLD